MAASSDTVQFGWQAPDFSLPATDGGTYGLRDVQGENGLLLMFICNHCPYVVDIMARAVSDAAVLQEKGVGVAAICSNDAAAYPDDSFDNMVRFAEAYGFPFPYLHDEAQEVAKAYDAQCTPDFFGFNADGGLQYRGRLDSARFRQDATGATRELLDAMTQVAQTGVGPTMQTPSMGCSIKWKPM